MDNQNIQISSDHVGILRVDHKTKMFDTIAYLSPEAKDHIKTRMLLTPAFRWTGKVIIDTRMFELTPGQYVGTAHMQVHINFVKCRVVTLQVYLTKRMLNGTEPFVETEARIAGYP